jgi:hypothetical protein
VDLAELLGAEPETTRGKVRLVGLLRLLGAKLQEELNEAALASFTLPPGKQAAFEQARADLAKIDLKAAAVSDLVGQGAIIGPAFEQRFLELLFESGAREERGLADTLETDVFDVAGCAEGLAVRGLIEPTAGGSDETPLRRWQIADKGRESIGYPSAR